MLLPILLALLASKATSGLGLSNPCSSILEYKTNTESNQWTASVNITSEVELKNAQLHVKLTNGNALFWGVPVDNFEVDGPSKVNPYESFVVEFDVEYLEGEEIPSVEKLKLNGKEICPGNTHTIKRRSTEILKSLKNPCPDILSYEADESNANLWTGIIKVISETELKTANVKVFFTNKNVLYWGTELDTFVISKKLDLKACEQSEISIPVSFKENAEVPSVKSLTLNGIDVCPGTSLTDAFKKCEERKNPVIPDDKNDEQEDIFCSPLEKNCQTDPRQNFDVECGTVVATVAPLVTHSEATIKGQYPWHGAIYYKRKTGRTYICGSSLVSKNHAITASHCVTKSKTSQVIKADRVVVYFGKYLLNNWSNQDIQERDVVEIISHPEYSGTNLQNDIAILKWNTSVEYSNWVRPICLWVGRTELTRIINTSGNVVGWGRNEFNELNEELALVRMPVVDTLTCIFSNRDFFSKFTHPKSYCAGLRNGSSVCNGDSGGGMIFPMTGTSPLRYQLRGIVSLSAATLGKCDTNQYAVFTDVAQYLSWIKQNLSL